MSAQIQVVRAERDDALADCALYIDRLLGTEDELRKSGLGCAALMSELSVVRAELVRRGGAERAFLRAQLFAVGGRELVCPVPTADGELVALADVYRGWMEDGRGEGIGLVFNSPHTGKTPLHSPWRLLSDGAFWATGRATSLATPAVIGLVGRVACVVGASMALPFKVQYAGEAAGGWMELPFIDQLAIVARLCRYSAFKVEQSMEQVTVLSGGALFILQLAEHEVNAWLESPKEATHRRGVRMCGVGEFFRASHLSFSAEIDPVP
jgi:hypothetical protein